MHIDFADEPLIPLFEATACHAFTRYVHFPLPNATSSLARGRSKADNHTGPRTKPLRSREHPWGFGPTEYASALTEVMAADVLSELSLSNRFVRFMLKIITRALRGDGIVF